MIIFHHWNLLFALNEVIRPEIIHTISFGRTLSTRRRTGKMKSIFISYVDQQSNRQSMIHAFVQLFRSIMRFDALNQWRINIFLSLLPTTMVLLKLLSRYFFSFNNKPKNYDIRLKRFLHNCTFQSIKTFFFFIIFLFSSNHLNKRMPTLCTVAASIHFNTSRTTRNLSTKFITKIRKYKSLKIRILFFWWNQWKEIEKFVVQFPSKTFLFVVFLLSV